jgi:hypothetical protein
LLTFRIENNLPSCDEMDDLLFFPSGKHEEALNSGHYLACVFLCSFFLLLSLGQVGSFYCAFNLGDHLLGDFQALTSQITGIL